MYGPRAAMLVNAGASIWGAGLSLVSAPLFVHMLGIETYGLIGLFATIQVLCSIFEFGLGPAFTRELSRLAEKPADIARTACFARYLEISVWCMAILIGAIFFLCAPFVALNWLNLGMMNSTDAVAALQLGAFVAFVQFPSSFYMSGLAGQQRLVLLGTISFPYAALRTLGILIGLWLIAPTVQVYFTLLAILTAANTLALRTLFWRGVPRDRKGGSTDYNHLREFLCITVGTSAVSMTGLVLTQADKLIASKYLPLDQFGYYILAASLAQGLSLVVGPISGTTFPRLSQSANRSDMTQLTEIYHAGTQMLVVAVVPLAAVFALFSSEILLAWTGNPAAVESSGKILSILACANGISGILALLYYLELSQGRTAPAIVSHVLSIVVLLPVTYFLILRFGAIGAAGGWLLHNLGMLVFRPPVTHLRLPKADQASWFTQDVGPVILAVTVAGICLKAMLVFPPSRGWILVLLGAVWLTLVIVAGFAAWRVRSSARAGWQALNHWSNDLSR